MVSNLIELFRVCYKMWAKIPLVRLLALFIFADWINMLFLRNEDAHYPTIVRRK